MQIHASCASAANTERASLGHIKEDHELVEFISSIVLTFPVQGQIYGTWANDFSENAFSKSRTAWMMLMVKEVREGGAEIRVVEDKAIPASKFSFLSA